MTALDTGVQRFDPRLGHMIKYSLLSGFARAVSSEVEHCLHTAGVTGSIPVSPTIEPRGYASSVTPLFFPHRRNVQAIDRRVGVRRLRHAVRRPFRRRAR